MVVLISYGQSSQGKTVQVHTKYEVWNWRKYPVVIREMMVEFRGVTPIRRDPLDGFEPEKWRVDRDGIARVWESARLEPNEHKVFECEVAIDRAGGGISVYCFDPRSGGHQAVKNKPGRWFKEFRQRGFGWAWSEIVFMAKYYTGHLPPILKP